nr:response regulator transcription factor [uncultured Sediminibacterium sp.]
MSVVNPVSIVIADDHDFFREGVSNYLLNFSKYKVEGQASNGEELISLVSSIKPDIIITDINMPGINGIQATGILLKKFPSIKVLAFSYLENTESVINMFLAGAAGYLSKGLKSSELVKAIDAVMANNLYFSSNTNKSITHLLENSSYLSNKFNNEVDLSNREIEIIKLVCENQTSYSIGKTLGISSRTVERHLSNIYRKISVNSAVSLVIYAIKNKLFTISDDSVN